MVSFELEARLDNLLATAQEETADIDLFAPIPDREECPICMITLPIDRSEVAFEICCGKRLCNGCIYKSSLTDNENGVERSKMLCAFCRQSTYKVDDIKALKRLMKKKNPEAFMLMARSTNREKMYSKVLQNNSK